MGKCPNDRCFHQYRQLVFKVAREMGSVIQFYILFYFTLFYFIYFWLGWVFVAARGLSLVAVSGGLLFVVVHGLQ